MTGPHKLEGGSSRPPFPAPVRWIEAVFATAAAVLLFAMMTMTFLDVLGRYLFNHPLGFAFEMTEIAMGAMVFCAIPTVTLRGQHVTTGLFENAFRGGWGAARDLLIALAICVSCAFLAWRLSILAERFVTFGDRTSALHFPLGIVAWLGVICLVAAALAAFIVAVRAFAGVRPR